MYIYYTLYHIFIKLYRKEEKWIKHIIRNNKWITTIIRGKVDGKAGRGKPRTPLMKQIIEDIGKTN